MRFTACLFDMNGVLVDDERLQEEAFRFTLATYGYDLSAASYQQYFIGKTDKAGYEAFLADHELPIEIDTLLTEKADRYRKLTAQGVVSYSGVAEFVYTLNRQNILLGVVTSSLASEAKTILYSLGLSEYFKVVITAEDVIRGKPDSEGYLKGTKALQVAPECCLVIEDAPSGLQAAHAAGMTTLAVLNTHTKRQLASADTVVRQLSSELATELISS